MKKILPSWMCCCILLLCNTPSLFGQDQHFEAERITGTQGLSQHYIYSILQDYRGFIWFGTKDGLNRFDGYTFKVYRNDPLDSTTLSDNYVLNIYEDRDSNLWIGTASGGLNKFNRRTETFTQCPNTVRDSATHSYLFIDALLKDDDVRFADGQEKIWLGTSGQGLWRYDVVSAQIERLLPLPHTQDSSVYEGDAAVVQRIYQDREKRIWVTTADAGLILVKDKDGTIPFKRFAPNKNKKLKQKKINVNHFFQARSGTLWVGTSEGLSALDPETETFTQYNFGHNLRSAAAVTHINETNDGTLWLNFRDSSGNNGGLAKFNPANGEYSIVVSNDKEVQKSLGSISWLYVDRSGVLWIGTGGYGIVKYNPAIERFGKQRKSLLHFLLEDVFRISSPMQITTLSEFTTPRSIVQEVDSTLWIAVDGKGIFHYSLRTHNILKSYKPFDFPGKEYMPINTGGRLILSQMMKRSSGELWIGTNGGILRMNTSAGSFEYLALYPRLDSSNVWLNSTGYPDITCLFEDANGVVWAGTPSLGLIRVDPKNYSTMVFQYDAKNPHSLSNNSILSVEQDPFDNNILWIGTDGGGVNRFDTFHKTFHRIQERDGLPNNVVYGVVSDRNGNLWMSTNKGISRYNISANTFRTFTLTQGLQDNEFNRFEYFRDANGTLYFGGINGCNAFNPELLKDNTAVPSVVLTDFRLFNESVQLKKEYSPLSTSITETKELTLQHSQNVITFEFAALEFSSPMNNNYAYKLSGFDKDWIYCGANRSVTYTNLDPGEYLFQVKGANNDGVWNEQGVSLRLTVMPPFWLTWWFRGVVALALLTGVVVAVLLLERRKSRERFQEIERKTALERERLRIARDMHDDLGARLTEIGMVGDSARKTEQKNIDGLIEKMTDLARETVAVFDEIVWAVNPRYDSTDHMLDYFCQYAEEYLAHTDIRCKFDLPEELPAISLSAEYRHNLFMIFKEALNNVVKHSGAKYTIIRCSINPDEINIHIIDDGKGFDVSSEKMFSEGLLSMKNRAEKVGCGLTMNSVPNNGTEIILTIPLPVQ